MKISTEINSIQKIVGMEKAVELCAKAGFDAWDFSMFDMCLIDWATNEPLNIKNRLNGPDYLKFARELKKIGLDNGIVCNQSHAPFPVESAAVRSYLKRAIECTAEAGGEICVIHPDNGATAEKNAEMYSELLPFAKDHGVKIATENMWSWNKGEDHSSFAACATAEDFIKHVDLINDEDFVACLDLGHAEMIGSGEGAANMIRVLGKRLKAMHIHDNDKIHDSHQIPFSMNVNFDEILCALKEIDYKGYFTLEAYKYLKNHDESNVFDGVVDLRNAARKLADKFENL